MIQKYDFLTCDFEYIFKFKKGEEKFDKLWQMKASARESLKDWLLVTDISPQISEICANACSELIENCIKYTQDETTAVVAIHATNTVITVETINPTKQNHKALLKDSIDTLTAVSDPKQLFVEKLLYPIDKKSHLGLIKIVMETKGTLELVQEQNDDVVHVKLHMNAA